MNRYALSAATAIMFWMVVKKPPTDVARRVRQNKEYVKDVSVISLIRIDLLKVVDGRVLFMMVDPHRRLRQQH